MQHSCLSSQNSRSRSRRKHLSARARQEGEKTLICTRESPVFRQHGAAMLEGLRNRDSIRKTGECPSPTEAAPWPLRTDAACPCLDRRSACDTMATRASGGSIVDS